MHDNFELFKGKKYSDLLKDIYHNSKRKDRQINTLISELQPLMKSMGDATVIVPLIKEYLEISVKNDDHLVKLAAIVQRLMSSTSSSGDDDSGYGMTEEEKRRLLEEAEEEILKIKEVQDANDANNL
jgi:hypothetical protein